MELRLVMTLLCFASHIAAQNRDSASTAAAGGVLRAAAEQPGRRVKEKLGQASHEGDFVTQQKTGVAGQSSSTTLEGKGQSSRQAEKTTDTAAKTVGDQEGSGRIGSTGEEGVIVAEDGEAEQGKVDGTGQGPPQYELVIARHSGRLQWVSKVAPSWHITVLNRGGRGNRIPKMPRGHKWSVFNMRNVGSNSEAFAQYLVKRYDSLAEYTVFASGNPFVHNDKFMLTLQSPTLLGTVQALSREPKRVRSLRAAGRKSSMPEDTWFAVERISTRTLNSVLIHDPQTVDIALWFAKDYNLTWGTNLVRFYFEKIGLKDWMDERQEVGSYAPGGLVGFERSRATRHPKKVYEEMLRTAPAFGVNPVMMERCWLMIFGGSDFQ